MREAIKASTYARVKLMRAVLAESRTLPVEFGRACRSQGALAHLAIKELGITPVSLNSLIAAASIIVEDGGWKKFDELRRSVFASWMSSQKSPFGTARSRNRASLNEEIARLRQLADQSDRGRLRIARAYAEILRITRSAATRDDQIKNELDRHLALWQKELGLPFFAKERDGEK